MEDPTQVPTQPQTAPPPVDNYEDWEEEQRRIRARAHANQARLALAEARRSKRNMTQG